MNTCVPHSIYISIITCVAICSRLCFSETFWMINQSINQLPVRVIEEILLLKNTTHKIGKEEARDEYQIGEQFLKTVRNPYVYSICHTLLQINYPTSEPY